MYRVGLSTCPARFFTIQKVDGGLYFSTSVSFAAFQISAQSIFFLTMLIDNILTDVSEELDALHLQGS